MNPPTEVCPESRERRRQPEPQRWPASLTAKLLLA